jgi:16S rRNA (cytosine1402-N4)-methyltransferase
VPVLREPILELAGAATRVVDATLGDGGHAEAFLARGAEVLGIDRDPVAIAVSRERLGEAGIHYLQASYDSHEALDAVAAFRPGFVLLDLGVSSRQLDESPRGFSFRPGVPLDMRMSRSGPDAADLLNRGGETELRRIFAEYGDERAAGRLAREIVRRRGRAPFRVSDDLVNAIRAVHGPRAGPAVFARLFQALRIAVNDELEGLSRALPQLRDSLIAGGTLAVISYHSGEDRVVKHAFREWSRACICPPGTPRCSCRGRPLGRLRPSRAATPAAEEIAANPRARSARLRGFQVMP